MKTALLDINVLVALFWPDHEHHDAALRWFQRRGSSRWASCPLTQLGFIRLVSNPALSREALTPMHAAALLARNIEAQKKHEFWPDDLGVTATLPAFESRIQGYRQLTDAYLIALARHRRGVFATFDRGARGLAGEYGESLVEMIAVP